MKKPSKPPRTSSSGHSGHAGHGGGSTQRPPGAPTVKLDPLATRLKAQPDWVQKELDGLRKHEATVLRALENEETHAQFIADPVAVLRKLKIPISGPLGQRVQPEQAFADLQRGIVFQLPNGQTITPKIRIRFTKERS